MISLNGGVQSNGFSKQLTASYRWTPAAQKLIVHSFVISDIL